MGFMQAPSSDGGNFKVYVSYNAKAGRWKTRKDEKDAPMFEVTNMTAIFDMPNLKTGWMLFDAGVAPVKIMDPGLDRAAPKPEGKFKRGFELDLFSEKNLLGLREFSSTAGCVIESMNDLYEQWQAGKAGQGDKLPVVKCVGVHEVVGANGSNYKPQFEIVGWAERPAEMPGDGPKGDASPTLAPAPKQQHTPAPAKPTPQPAMADDDVEF